MTPLGRESLSTWWCGYRTHGRAVPPCTPASLRPPTCTASLSPLFPLPMLGQVWGGDRLGATEDKRLPEFIYGECPEAPPGRRIPDQGSPGAEENLPLAFLGLSSLGKVGALPSGF